MSDEITTEIKDTFEKEAPIIPERYHYEKLKRYVLSWEQRGDNLIGLTSPYFGEHPVLFIESDEMFIYELFGFNRRSIVNIIADIDAIRKDFRVASHPFNVFSMWILHRLWTKSKLSENDKKDFTFLLGKFFIYRFFTSIRSHYFPHGINVSIMEQVHKGLNNQSDIIVYGTWKAVIENFVEKHFANEKFKHIKVLKASGFTDNSFIFIITDANTKIRSRIKNITSAYYEIKDDPKRRVVSQDAVVEVDGKKLLRENVSFLDDMVFGVSEMVENKEILLSDGRAIGWVVDKILTGVSKRKFMFILENFSTIASNQKEMKINKEDIYIEYQEHSTYPNINLLTKDIVRATYRYCISKKVDIENKVLVLKTARNVYPSSRISDEDILSIRERMGIIVRDLVKTNRDATLSSLRTAIIIYLITQSFKFHR